MVAESDSFGLISLDGDTNNTINIKIKSTKFKRKNEKENNKKKSKIDRIPGLLVIGLVINPWGAIGVWLDMTLSHSLSSICKSKSNQLIKYN